MQTVSLAEWAHDHTFGQDAKRPGERRTLIVAGITALMMVVEIVAGVLSGSMALLADGLHMASHAAALAISVAAYSYTRRHARDQSFSFGTGKINALSGFASAVLLVGFALLMAWESGHRILAPVPIDFNDAILVALLGLAVNAISVALLTAEHHHDHNLWAAYLHVVSDAMTSVLAVGALLAGKHFGFVWLDPVIGIVGAGLVAHWSWGLIRSSSHILLDRQAPLSIRQALRKAIEHEGDSRVTDLHVWSVGPGIFAAEIGIVTSSQKEPAHYRRLLPQDVPLVHAALEVIPYRRGQRAASNGGAE